MKDYLLKVAKPYGVKGINFGGCIAGQSKGFKGAMRSSAHAHWTPGEPFRGWICCKSSKIEKFLTADGRPNQLFWHEVGHIYRSSWTEAQCDKFGWQQVRNFR